VAAEHNWDAVRFLCETCRKAGLAPDAWKHGAVIEAFTAEVIKQVALAGAVLERP
jgi:AMMECR1 domain-containing protein